MPYRTLLSIFISIHALCEEGDQCSVIGLPHLQDFYPRPLRGGRRREIVKWVQKASISIHALCEEGDKASWAGKPERRTFLSTPSARRATKDAPADSVELADFYPRPLRGGRRH